MPLIALRTAALAIAGDTVHEVELRRGIDEVLRNDRMINGSTHQDSPTSDPWVRTCRVFVG